MGAPHQRSPSPPCPAKPASPAQRAVRSQPVRSILAVSRAAKRHWKGSSRLASSLPCKLLQREVSDNAARWTVCCFSFFGRRAKDLTDFQLQHISYVGVWSIWQEESPIASVQTHWPGAPVFIRTRGAIQRTQERLQGHPRWRMFNLQPQQRLSPERGWGWGEVNPA